MKDKVKIHGLISVLLLLDAFVVALFAIGEQSLWIAGTYLLLFIGYFIIVSIEYCSKCLCQESCNHLIMGKLSKLFSKAKQENDTKKDLLLGVVLPFLPVLIIPQFYLIQNTFYLLLFWILLVLAYFEIYFFVCKDCKNVKCSVCRLKFNKTN